MLNFYVVICAVSLSHHAVDMHSLWEYYYLYYDYIRGIAHLLANSDSMHSIISILIQLGI